ncbi:MAG: ABC transporter permease [Pirellulales bacterium]|nr:ABC transporter permease [Pirellulales bacterium]
MTTVEATPGSQPLSAPGESGETPRAPSRFGAWLDRVTFRTADILNPILIKEGRQSLKSRGFSIPFLLVLIACLFWSFLGVTAFEDVYYGAVGMDFFIGYFTILAFPLLVIVPFGAFRSLTGEREDGTFELLSITTLRPAQIVNGKLASAVMQMVVYLSAVAPCVAFTYLLRGIDLFTIAMVLFWLSTASLTLSILCLMLATLTTARHWQILMTVVVITGLAFGFFSITISVGNGLNEISWVGAPGSWEFWAVNFGMLSGVVMGSALAYSVAHAQLKFPTDNRSTSVRIVMLLTAAVFVAWMGWGTWTFADTLQDATMPIGMAAMAFFAYWFVMGAFLVGEYGELSRRVKRTLPRSFPGRMLSTWFMPGSGTGYILAIACGVSGALFGLISASVAAQYLPNTFRFRFFNISEMQQVLAYLLLYLTLYLGIGRLLVLLLRKQMYVGVVGSLLLNLILVVLGSLMPLFIEVALFQSTSRGNESQLMQMTSPVYIIVEAAESNIGGGMFLLHMAAIGSTAVLVFLANLTSVIREIRQQRVAEPNRVREEKAASAPAVEVPAATNPFDD